MRPRQLTFDDYLNTLTLHSRKDSTQTAIAKYCEKVETNEQIINQAKKQAIKTNKGVTTWHVFRKAQPYSKAPRFFRGLLGLNPRKTMPIKPGLRTVLAAIYYCSSLKMS